MRFPKETRALIHQADGNAITITWPPGAGEPQKGRLYWLQSEEQAKEAERREKARREASPDTHAEVLAGMHRRRYGTEPPPPASIPTVSGKPKKVRAKSARPTACDERILVIDTTILEVGWEAKVVIYEEADPVNHLRLATKVPSGANPIDGFQEPTELEPEHIPHRRSRREREEDEDALRTEHEVSVDRSKILDAEERLRRQRRKGKPGKLALSALDRARKRADPAESQIAA